MHQRSLLILDGMIKKGMEEGRLMAIGGRGFIPVESVGTLPQPQATLTRIPLTRGSKQITRNYCVFWRKENSGYYIEEFADTLKKLLKK